MSEQNRLYPAARHSEEVTRKIVRCFAENISLEKAAERCGFEKKRIGSLFGMLRTHLAPHFDMMQERVEQHPRWERYVGRLKQFAGALWKKQQAGVLDISPSGNLVHTGDATQDDVNQSGHGHELDAFSSMMTEAIINNQRSAYIKFMRGEKRGILSDNLELFEKEYRYRFAVMCCCRCDEEGDMELPMRTYADGHKELVLQKPDYKALFAQTACEANSIEKQILGVLERYPLK